MRYTDHSAKKQKKKHKEQESSYPLHLCSPPSVNLCFVWKCKEMISPQVIAPLFQIQTNLTVFSGANGGFSVEETWLFSTHTVQGSCSLIKNSEIAFNDKVHKMFDFSQTLAVGMKFSESVFKMLKG